MQRIKHNGHYLEMWDSIDELPITRFQEFNKNIMIDAGIGSDLNAFDSHLAAIIRMMKKGNTKDAETELMNMRQNLAFAISGISPKSNAFVVMIKKMNGRSVDDLSGENIQSILDELSRAGWTADKIHGWVDDVKKKLTRNLKRFSRMFWMTRP